MKDVDVRQRQGFLRPPHLSWRKPRHRQSPSQHGVAGLSAFPPWDTLPLPAPPRWHHGSPLLRRAAGCAPRGVPRASSALPFYTALAAPRCCWLRIHQEKEGNNEVESVKRGANAGAMMIQGAVPRPPRRSAQRTGVQPRHLQVHARERGSGPGAASLLAPAPAQESPAAQCIAPEEQSGSALKAKISVLKDAIKQSRGRVYREAIAVRGEKWSPEANPTGFIACYR